jgi:DNA-binding NarL/FixJ family response regulator
MKSKQHPYNSPTTLSERETQVLELLAQGLGIDEIAQQLQIMRPTVRNHVSSMQGKLGVHSQLEAVVTAFRLGIVKLPSGKR